MKRRTMRGALSAFFLSVTLFACAASTQKTAGVAQGQDKYHIRFALAHRQYNDWIIKSLRKYGDSLERESGGRLTMELIPIAERNEDRFREGAAKVLHGEMEMSQVSLVALADYAPSLRVMEMPFLFRNHAHAAAVMDGPVGKELFDELFSRTEGRLRGLAYTYSGGLRAILTHSKDILRYEDLRGLKMGVPTSPVGRDIFRLLQARLRRSPAGTGIFLGEDIDARETQCAFDLKMTDPGKKVVYNETDHSLFMTGIIVNEKFFQSLPQDLRNILSGEAQKMALEERVISLEEKKDAIALLEKNGSRVTKMSDAEKARMLLALQPVYAKYDLDLGKYVNAIRASAGGTKFAAKP